MLVHPRKANFRWRANIFAIIFLRNVTFLRNDETVIILSSTIESSKVLKKKKKKTFIFPPVIQLLNSKDVFTIPLIL